ncbi:tyrosine-type recombinase/integrase [Govanella unica]|uniref:Site-specific integrase n=1 Tax=Govanella unica TaxID=2975056 RepID=A0A9X3TXZ4_9PROT|nr:tyrosine-type recombinase/integrase [Govania unica]MDA5193718.1 site-specific integrase [Govania unica]
MRAMKLTDARVALIKANVSKRIEYPDELLTGLRLRVGTSGRKSWIVRARIGSQIVNKTLGTYPNLSLSKAREKARQFLIESADRGHFQPVPLFEDVATQFIEQYAKPKNRSWHLQQRRFEIHVLPHWRGRRVDSIRRADVIAIVDNLFNGGSKVSANRLLVLLKTFFKFCIRKDYIESSPAEAVDKPAEEVSRDRYLSEKEIKFLWSAATLLGYPFGPMVKILLLTGQRRTEVASMKWSDLDLDKGEWILSAKDTKNAKKHLVPLSPLVVQYLKALPVLGDYIFTTDGETCVSGYSKFKVRLDKFMKFNLESNEAKWEEWHLHDLRRTVATHMARLGIPEFIVSKVLNHSVGQGITARVYNVYSYAAEKRHALETLGSEIATLVGEPIYVSST